MKLDHVAVLVRSLDRAMSAVRALGLEPLPPQAFAREGTRESYVGDPGRSGRLLLIEAIGPGPYERALRKRGPGLHHLALECEAAKLLEAGWVAHPATDGWFYKTGAPFLIERSKTSGARPLIERLQISSAPISELGSELFEWNATDASVVLSGRKLALNEFLE